MCPLTPHLILDSYAALAHLISVSIDVPLLIIVTLIAIAPLAYERKWKHAVAIVLALLTTAALTTIAKEFFAVPRPGHLLVPEESFRFPSAHASASAAFITIVLLLYWPRLSSRMRSAALILGILIVLGVAYTRLALGVHCGVDVLVGAGIGMGVSWGIYLLFFPKKPQTSAGGERRISS